MAVSSISSPSSTSFPHPFRLNSSLFCPKSNSRTITCHFPGKSFAFSKKQGRVSICLVMAKKTEEFVEIENGGIGKEESFDGIKKSKLGRKKLERYGYLVAALISSVGITSMAAFSVYYRFSCQFEGSGEFPVIDMLGTFALSVAASVGMEFWARWAHRVMWHDSLWSMHKSHHRPRNGAFEVNDIFAITNALPAIALLSYGFFNQGFVPSLCYGAGIGITVFGMAYMFVHDGLVHRRFPVGPISNVPYLRTVAAAHQLHHADKFGGVPYGLFLGHKELEEVGGMQELEKEVQRRINH